MKKVVKNLLTFKTIVIVVIIIILIIGSVYIYLNPESFLTKYLNSSYLLAVITGIGGGIAFYTYFKQKADTKRDAAKTLFAEMINAETIIKRIKDKKEYSDTRTLNLGLDPMQFYLGNFSWSQYKYLFIKDFDSYEWEKINLYFSQCNTFNNSIKDIASLLPKNIEYRTQFTQEILAKIALEQAKKLAELEKPTNLSSNVNNDEYKTYQDQMSKITNKYKDITNSFIYSYIGENNSPMIYSYNPINSYSLLERDLDKIDTEISKSSIGKKLGKLSY